MAKKYHIITYGCQMNKSDSERIAGVLEKIGYQEARNINGADLVVVNMCSVRQSAVDRVYGLVEKTKKRFSGTKTILTGCFLKKDKRKFDQSFDWVLNIKDLAQWPKIINKSQRQLNSVFPKRQSNSALIPISNGCNNFCAYCVVPFTRGRLTCRPPEEIIKEVKNAIKNGLKDIWLLGQNVNDYQIKLRAKSEKRKTIDFAGLLKMVNDVPGDFSIRFTSPHPKNFSGELIETMADCKKIAPYLNLPIQSGDDKILKRMGRNYTVQEYKNLVKKIRQKIPNLFLSTDIIVGFPGETKKQFQNTVKLFKEIGFDMAYIAKYSPRSGTRAFQLEDNIPPKEKKRRWKILNDILKIKLKANVQ